jgi:hypothetical protein
MTEADMIRDGCENVVPKQLSGHGRIALPPEIDSI